MAVEEKIKKAIVTKLKTIKKPPRVLTELLSGPPAMPLRDLLKRLVADGYDTFICYDVLAILGTRSTTRRRGSRAT